MTDAIRLTVEVSKRVYQTGHSEKDKTPNRDDGNAFSKTAMTQWPPPSSDSIKRDNSFPVEQTKSFTVNLSKTQLSPQVERWNWVEETTTLLPRTSTVIFDQFQNATANPQKPPERAKTPGQTVQKEPVKTPVQPKTSAANAPVQPVNKDTGAKKPSVGKVETVAAPTETETKGGVKVPKKKGSKAPEENPEQVALEKMKAKRKQPRPCKCGKAKDVTLLLKDLCQCDTLNLRRINLVKLFAQYQKDNKSGNPLPYLTDSLIVYKERRNRPQHKEKVEWTTIPRKGKKGVQFKKPVDGPVAPVKKTDSKKKQDEMAKIEEEFKKLEKKDKSKSKEIQKDVGQGKKEDKGGKKKVQVTVKYAEESLVTLFKNTSKKESMYNLTDEQFEKLNSD